jgi:D-sedoheptulose 7-phosphate isomerase
MGAVSISLTDALTGMGAVAVDADLIERCARAADVMIGCLREGQRVWFCGNGGSAAEAQHLAA